MPRVPNRAVSARIVDFAAIEWLRAWEPVQNTSRFGSFHTSKHVTGRPSDRADAGVAVRAQAAASLTTYSAPES